MSDDETPKVARLMTIGQIAREAGQNKRSVFRRLMAMHARDVANGEAPWLFRHDEGGWWLCNLSRMRAIHPGVFTATHVSRQEFTTLAGRVQGLEERGHNLHSALGATRAKLRTTVERLDLLEKRVASGANAEA